MSFHRSGVNSFTCAFHAGPPWTNSHTVAATRLVWTAVILNSSETSGPLSNGRIVIMCSLEVYIKSFGGQKGGLLEPPWTPPCLRACFTYTSSVLRTVSMLRMSLLNFRSVPTVQTKRNSACTWSGFVLLLQVYSYNCSEGVFAFV